MVGDPLQSERTLTADEIGQPDVSKDVRGETLAQAYAALQTELKDKAAQARRRERRRVFRRLPLKAIALWLVVGGMVFAVVTFRGNIAGFFKRQLNLKQTRALAILEDAQDSRSSGDLVAALELINKALEVDPAVPGGRETLRDVRAQLQADIEGMYRQGNYDRAIAYADSVLSVDPKNEEVKMLARLAREDQSRYAVRLEGIMTGRDGKCVAALRTSVHGAVNVSEGDVLSRLRVERIDRENYEVIVFDEKRGVTLTIRKDGVFERNP
jgi:tetratricopeptide (TPR) repeat protein